MPRALDRMENRQTYLDNGIVNFPDSGALWYTVAATNTRLKLIEEVVSELTPLIEDRQRLSELADRLDRADGDELGDPPTDPTADALRRVLNEIGGVTDKELVDVEVISPLVVAQNLDRGVSELLAGDFIGAFGGFLSRQLRVSDFELGWSSTRQWMPEALERRGLEQRQIDEICDRLDTHVKDGDDERDPTESGGISSLGLRGRFRLARLAGRVGRILVESAAPDIVTRHAKE